MIVTFLDAEFACLDHSFGVLVPLRHSGFDTLHYSGVTHVRINGFDGVDSFFFDIRISSRVHFHSFDTAIRMLVAGCVLGCGLTPGGIEYFNFEDTLNPDVCYCILALSSTLLSATALLGLHYIPS